MPGPIGPEKIIRWFACEAASVVPSDRLHVRLRKKCPPPMRLGYVGPALQSGMIHACTALRNRTLGAAMEASRAALRLAGGRTYARPGPTRARGCARPCR